MNATQPEADTEYSTRHRFKAGVDDTRSVAPDSETRGLPTAPGPGGGGGPPPGAAK